MEFRPGFPRLDPGGGGRVGGCQVGRETFLYFRCEFPPHLGQPASPAFFQPCISLSMTFLSCPDNSWKEKKFLRGYQVDQGWLRMSGYVSKSICNGLNSFFKKMKTFLQFRFFWIQFDPHLTQFQQQDPPLGEGWPVFFYPPYPNFPLSTSELINFLLFGAERVVQQTFL